MPAIPVHLVGFLFLRAPKYADVPALPGSDILYSPGDAAGNSVSKVTGQQFHGALWLQVS